MMTGLLVTLALSILSISPGVASEQTDEGQAGLIGSVRTVSAVHLGKELDGWRERQRVVTTYDPKGNEIEVAFYNSSNAGGSLYEKAVHTYDTHGRRIRTGHYRGDGSFLGKAVYAADAQGHLTDVVSYDASDSVVYKTHYTYDDKGNLTEETVYPASGPPISHVVHTYDAQGHRIETTSEDLAHDATLGVDKTVETYDTHGNILELTTYYTEKAGDDENVRPIPPPGKILYTYEWDVHGNWVKQTQTLCSSETGQSICEPSLVTYRTITYYDETKAP